METAPPPPVVVAPAPDDRLLMAVFAAQIGILAAIGALFALAVATSWVGVFGFAVLAGALGASLALLRRCQRGEVVVSRGRYGLWVAVGMPCLYGALMAGVAYFLFASELLSGDGGGGLLTSNLFPIFNTLETPEGVRVRDWLALRPLNFPDGGKLIVWSVVAGYSEGFVTGILRRLDESAGT